MISPNIMQYLSDDQIKDYRSYKASLEKAFLSAEHPQRRMDTARHEIEPVEVQECIPFNQPYDIDAPCAVVHPHPGFIAELMHGGIHPTISANLEKKILLISESGKSEVVAKIDAPEWRAKNGPIQAEYVVDARRCLSDIEGPLTYEQAIEYCIMISIPVAVWGRQHNKRQFVIIKKDALPDRSARDAWELAA